MALAIRQYTKNADEGTTFNLDEGDLVVDTLVIPTETSVTFNLRFKSKSINVTIEQSMTDYQLFLYKVKNNAFCNYLLFIKYEFVDGFSIIPIKINNTINLVECDSNFTNYFYFGDQNLEGILLYMFCEIDGSENNSIIFEMHDDYNIVLNFKNNNNKLLLEFKNISHSAVVNFDIAFTNGEVENSEEFKAYKLSLSSAKIYDKDNNVINDNGFFAFILQYFPNWLAVRYFIYKNYLIVFSCEQSMTVNHIYYAQVNDSEHKITEFNKLDTSEEYLGFFPNFCNCTLTHLFLNYYKNYIFPTSINYQLTLEDMSQLLYFVDIKEKNNYPFSSVWEESDQFVEETTRITYQFINYEDLGNNTLKLIFYYNENIINTLYLHFDNNAIPYQLELNSNNYPLTFDNEVHELDISLNERRAYYFTFYILQYSITIVDNNQSENFRVNEYIDLTNVNRIITSIYIVNFGLFLDIGVRFNDKTYNTDEYDRIAIVTYGYKKVEWVNFQIENIIDNGNFNQAYSGLELKNNFTITINTILQYQIRFLDYDGTVLEQKVYNTNEIPSYSGGTPTRTGYTFAGWNPSIQAVTKNQDYTATYTINSYTIRFLNEDESVLETKQVNYGTTPTFTGTEPTKDGYTFVGWSPTPYPATKNQDYKAVFRNNAFALTLYKNTAENNRIDKTEYLTSVGEITGYLREETNIINPSIVIEYTGVIDFNYVYISTFNRYYFVNNITSVRTNLWRLDMSCDVLMTYKETILNYDCYVSRNENNYNEDIEDNYLPLEYEKVVEVTNLYNDTYDNGKVFLESDYSVVFTTIYTGSLYKVSDEEVSTEFQDLEGNLLKVSSISLGASNYRCIGVIENNVLDNLNKLVEKTINDDTLASYIISLIVFPISGTKLSIGNTQKYPSKLLIKDDSTSMTVTQDDVYYPAGGVLAPVVANQFTIKPKYNNFLDYEPYTTYEIFLPFYGWLKLNSYQILNEPLVVTYFPQVDSEQCSIIISKGNIVSGSTEVIAEVTCQLGIQIPVNSTNVERINREKSANTLNSVVGSLTGVAIAGAGAVTGNPLAVVGGASMAIGSITSGISKNMTMLPSAQSKSGSSYDGAMSDRIFKLRITYPKIAVDDISKYAKYIGRPLQTNVKLNTLTGYTIVGGVHIENLGTATDNEKTDIENQLRKGVII